MLIISASKLARYFLSPGGFVNGPCWITLGPMGRVDRPPIRPSEHRAGEITVTMRELRLPQDLIPLADLLTEAFHYPENPAWDVQSDEQEEMIDSFTRLARIWPLISLLMLVSPSLRDTIRGYLWEQDGQAVGAALVQRKGSSDIWEMGNVAVLPAHRRQGIARKLILACLELIRSHDGRLAFLEVVQGNLPAQRLYEELGFVAYGGEVLLDRMPPHPHVPAPPPPGFTTQVLNPFDWRRRYEFEKRVTPAAQQAFEPIEPSRFRQPALLRLLRPILLAAQGREVITRSLVHSGTNRTAATYRISLPTRGVGVIQINAAVEPESTGLGEAVAGDCIATVSRHNLDLRIEWIIPDWMPALTEAAEALGFRCKYEAIRMGHLLR